ncbi:glycosyltransferase family 4 protein [Clostridium sp. C105KSO13]|uniref:glycosyltransferase family 4 protein n=1 Tax=Clostridium sp. C105KSO13 TaxID=1776045 RepID=UPI00074081F1|nr:glycosyltransferase family 4 protein [Clostridium sp. C105KSO13]CUX34397.1 Glycogen synthase [Clostridium sp. C105KSO13]
MKSKLLVTASTFPRWAGDTEPRFVLDISKALLAYYDVTVLVPACPNAKDEEVLEGVRVIRYHYFPIHKWETLCYPGAIVPRIREKEIRGLLVPFLFLGLWLKLKKICKDYDKVHAHWIIPQGIVQSFFDKKYVITGHGGDVTSLNKGIIKRLKVKCLKRADKITVVSKALAEEVKKLYPEAKTEIISMGCDTSKFGKKYYQENYFNQNRKKVILFVGRLAEKKGVTYLIDAMKYVDGKLVIVGDGPLKDSLVAQAESYGDKIEFWGSKTHEELKNIYASADIFVAPSVTTEDGDKEGLGLVLLEAMASGLPVVGSNSGGIPEIVENGYNGFLVAERDVQDLSGKINVLLNSEKIQDKFSKNGLKVVSNRDYSKIAEKYYRLMEK